MQATIMKGFLTIVCLAVIVAVSANLEKKGGKHWALIVAGSNGYFNYRHQADACHAYHVMSKHGIPDDRIVVMMYDDIANNKENPTPGIIINHPNGSDVYKGVPKDYTGKDVTPENFLNILQGKKEAMQGIGSGKVIASGSNDHVFVYFTDHGAPGLIAFPSSEEHSNLLKARDFMNALTAMHEANKYKQMVIYIEACESGSMFSNLLPDDISIYATTAANTHESSYACYYDKKRMTYLGDLYSVKWLEDSDKENLNKETLEHQYEITKKETNTSHVMQYGSMDISKEAVGEFQGTKKAAPSRPLPNVPLNAVRSEDVPMAILHHRLQDAQTQDQRNTILTQMREIAAQKKAVEDSMKSIVTVASLSDDQAERVLNHRRELLNYDCYEPVVDTYDKHCFDLSTVDYALRHLYALVNLCEERIPIETINKAIYKVCAHHLY